MQLIDKLRNSFGIMRIIWQYYKELDTLSDFLTLFSLTRGYSRLYQKSSEFACRHRNRKVWKEIPNHRHFRDRSRSCIFILSRLTIRDPSTDEIRRLSDLWHYGFLTFEAARKQPIWKQMPQERIGLWLSFPLHRYTASYRHSYYESAEARSNSRYTYDVREAPQDWPRRNDWKDWQNVRINAIRMKKLTKGLRPMIDSHERNNR